MIASRTRMVCTCLMALGMGSIVSSANAAAVAFDGGTNGTGTDMDSGVNWTGDNKPLTNDAAILDSTSVSMSKPLPAQLTTTSANQTYGNLIFNATTNSTITINTGTGTNATITLTGNAGSGALTARGGDAADLLLIGSTTTSNTLTFTGNVGVGTGRLSLVLAKDGNFDVLNSGAAANVGVVVSGAFNLAKTGAGKLTLSGTNTFGGSGKTFTLAAGTLNINNASALGSSSNTFVISGGTLDNTSAGNITTSNYAQTWNANFTYAGSIGNNLDLGTGAVSLGSAAGTTRSVTVSSNTLTVGGIISNGTTANSLTKLGSGTLVLGGASAYTGTTTVSAGTLRLGASASLTSAVIDVASGATFDVSNVSGGYTLASGKTLKGKGTVLGNITLAGGSNHSPGNSPGKMTITGTYTQQQNATLNIEINGTDQGDLSPVDGVGYDFVSISGAASLDGILKAILTDGFTPTFGSAFNVLTASSITLGSHFTLDTTMASFGPNYFESRIISGGNGQILQLVAVPLPASGLMGLALLTTMVLPRHRTFRH